MRLILMTALIGLGVGAACAPVAPGMAQAGGARECFFVSEVQSFASSDDRSVYVRTGSNEVFELQTFGCSNADWSREIGIAAARGGGSSICSSMDAVLIVPDLPGGRTTCPVTGVRRLTDAELATLDERDRP